MDDPDDGSRSDHYSSSAPVIVREKVKRSARACVSCRRLKKTCEGGAAPCVRCKASGTVCVYDRPASSVVEDAGLTRLAAIEAALSTNERRMDHVCQQMGEIHNILYDVLTRLKHAGPPGSVASVPSPASLAYPGAAAGGHAPPLSQLSPAALSTSSQAQAHHGTPPSYLHPAAGASSASPASGLHSLPLHPVSMGLPAYPSGSGSGAGVLPRRASYPPPAPAPGPPAGEPGAALPYSSGLDALASLASSSSSPSAKTHRAADVTRFASRIRQPISALADAVAQLGGDEEGSGVGSGSASSEGKIDDDDEEEGKMDQATVEGEERKPRGDKDRAAVEGARGGARGVTKEEGSGAKASALSGAAGVSGTATGPGMGLAAPGRKDSRERGEPPRKKSRIGGAAAGAPAPHAGPSVDPDRFDVVAKGLIGDTEARALVLLWMKECQPFCAVLDAGYDTYESMRRRSAFLFNTVIFTALRMNERNGAPSKELLAAAEETKRFARHTVFENNPDLEVVQAMLIMACYHQEPYVLSGMSLRLALSARMETAIEQIDAHGWQATDDKARRLTAQLRTWIYVVQLENQHSRNLGRMNLIDERDLDALVAQADRALSLPFAQGSDFRHVGNLRLSAIVRKIMQDTAALAEKEPSFDEQVAYVSEKKQLLHDWYAHYDNLIASWEPSTLSWPRKSHLRMWHDAQLTLLVNTFRGRLLDRPATATYEHTQIVLDALQHARMCLQQVLGSAVYRMGTQWSGYLLRVDMSFAAIFLLKSAAAWPHLVDRDEVAKDVALLANLLSDVAGSLKYAAMLRAARAQFLSRTAPTPIGNVMSSAPSGVPLPVASAALAASSPTSSSLRNILVPAVSSAHSAPLSTFATTSVPPHPASIPLPSALPPPPRMPPLPPATLSSSASPSLGSSFPATDSSDGMLPASGPGPVGGGPGGMISPLIASIDDDGSIGFAPPPAGLPLHATAALMPGEMEIDWNLAIPPSLFDDSLMMQHDWTATANWLDGM